MRHPESLLAHANLSLTGGTTHYTSLAQLLLSGTLLHWRVEACNPGPIQDGQVASTNTLPMQSCCICQIAEPGRALLATQLPVAPPSACCRSDRITEINCCAGHGVQCVRPRRDSPAYFWPTLTAWKLRPNRRGTEGRVPMPLLRVPLIWFRTCGSGAAL